MARTKQTSRKSTAGASKVDGKKRSYRWLPGTVSLREIKRYQTKPGDDCRLMIPKLAFSRLVREVTQEIQTEGAAPIRFKPTALSALQHATEAHLTELFAESQDYAIHARHETVEPNDFRMAVWKATVPPQSRNLHDCPVKWRKPRKSALARRRHKSSLRGRIVPNDDEGPVAESPKKPQRDNDDSDAAVSSDEA